MHRLTGWLLFFYVYQSVYFGFNFPNVSHNLYCIISKELYVENEESFKDLLC